MSLTQILKEMETARPNAEMDINLGRPETQRGREGLKRAAKDQMERLKIKYRKELMSSMAFIIVTGSQREAFTELAASDKFGCLSADPESFHKGLVSKINPVLFGRENAKNLFNILGNILYDRALELDMVEYSPLSFNDKYNRAVNAQEDLVEILKEAVSEQVGSEIVGINAVHSVVDTAIKKGHDAPVTPIVLSANGEKFALDLKNGLKKSKLKDGMITGLTDKVFLVIAGKASKNLHLTEGAISVKTVSEESVGEALSQIRSKIL